MNHISPPPDLRARDLPLMIVWPKSESTWQNRLSRRNPCSPLAQARSASGTTARLRSRSSRWSRLWSCGSRVCTCCATTAGAAVPHGSTRSMAWRRYLCQRLVISAQCMSLSSCPLPSEGRSMLRSPRTSLMCAMSLSTSSAGMPATLMSLGSRDTQSWWNCVLILSRRTPTRWLMTIEARLAVVDLRTTIRTTPKTETRLNTQRTTHTAPRGLESFNPAVNSTPK
mmetsp:Transcript_12898/g.29629  ORF Transcript_12898/g.29629 Transcript_12898/m.29629 type:complete len:226 (-) Transcript_12898:4493-5170(-)